MRTSVSRAAALLVAVLLASPAAAQTVDDVIAKNLEAKGGVARLKETQSVRTTGKATMQGQGQAMEVAITTSTKRPYFMLNEMTMGGQKMRQGFDGETMWMAVDGMPAQALPPGPQVDILKQNSQIDSPLLDYKAKGTKIELAGTETEGTAKLHHLVITPKSGPAMHYYIDAATGLESRIVVEAEDQGQTMKMEMRFSDFKTIDGRTMPFAIKQFVNGNQVGQVTFEKVEFNVPLEDAIFRMPK